MADIKKSWIHKRGKIYWIRYYTRAGERFDESSKSRNRKDAEKLLKIREAEVLNETLPEKGMNKILLSQMLDNLVTHNKRKGNRSTPRIAHLLRIIGDKPAKYIDQAAIEHYVDTRREETGYKGSPVKDGTINLELAALRRAFNLARAKHLVDTVPSFEVDMTGLDLDNEGNDERRGYYISPEDFEKMVEGMQKAGATTSYINGLAWVRKTGWRVGQSLSLKWEWVKDDEVVVPRSDTKTKKVHRLDLRETPELRAILDEQRKTTGDKTGLVFPGEDGKVIDFKFFPPRRTWSDATRYAGLGYGYRLGRLDEKNLQGPLTIHALRASFITDAMDAGIPIHEIMAATGHTNEATLRKSYLKRKAARAGRAIAKVNVWRNGDGIERVTVTKEELIAGLKKAYEMGKNGEDMILDLGGTFEGTKSQKHLQEVDM